MIDPIDSEAKVRTLDVLIDHKVLAWSTGNGYLTLLFEHNLELKIKVSELVLTVPDNFKCTRLGW